MIAFFHFLPSHNDEGLSVRNRMNQVKLPEVYASIKFCCSLQKDALQQSKSTLPYVEKLHRKRTDFYR